MNSKSNDNQVVVAGRRLCLNANVSYEIDAITRADGYLAIDARAMKSLKQDEKQKRQRSLSTTGKRILEAKANGWLDAGSDGSSRDR